jgi:hypothetical protein
MNGEDSNEMWFAYDWEDRFRFFLTQAEAITWAESQIPRYFNDDDEEWDDDITYLRVGCLTHQAGSVPNKNQDYCDYQLKQIVI